MKIMFDCNGLEPFGKERPRASFVNGIARIHTAGKTIAYENTIKWCYRAACKGAYFDKGKYLRCEIVAYFRIPKRASKKDAELMRKGVIRPDKKPDADNIIKVCCDALNELAWKDDVQIVEAVCYKFYADEPHIMIIITDELSRNIEDFCLTNRHNDKNVKVTSCEKIRLGRIKNE